MGTPSRKELQQWAANYVSLWNAGDREGWAQNWRRRYGLRWKLTNIVFPRSAHDARREDAPAPS